MTATSEDVFRAVADPRRRKILDLLLQGERRAGEIAEAFAVSRPAISKHLRILLEVELVERRKEGRQRLYSLNATPLQEVEDWVSRYSAFWQTSLERLKAHVERGAVGGPAGEREVDRRSGPASEETGARGTSHVSHRSDEP